MKLILQGVLRGDAVYVHSLSCPFMYLHPDFLPIGYSWSNVNLPQLTQSRFVTAGGVSVTISGLFFDLLIVTPTSLCSYLLVKGRSDHKKNYMNPLRF